MEGARLKRIVREIAACERESDDEISVYPIDGTFFLAYIENRHFTWLERSLVRSTRPMRTVSSRSISWCPRAIRFTRSRCALSLEYVSSHWQPGVSPECLIAKRSHLLGYPQRYVTWTS